MTNTKVPPDCSPFAENIKHSSISLLQPKPGPLFDHPGIQAHDTDGHLKSSSSGVTSSSSDVSCDSDRDSDDEGLE